MLVSNNNDNVDDNDDEVDKGAIAVHFYCMASCVCKCCIMWQVFHTAVCIAMLKILAASLQRLRPSVCLRRILCWRKLP